MHLTDKIETAKHLLEEHQMDGWLLYDFRRSNALACEFLEIPPHQMLTRRFFYWIPKTGDPIKIVSGIEPKTLEHLPGKTVIYHTWKELEASLESNLSECKVVAMEYSPRNRVPYLSKVDAGTIEIIKDLGADVVSSAVLLQKFLVWDEKKLSLHLLAAEIVSETVDRAWDFISDCLKKSKRVTEYDVQQMIISEFTRRKCVFEGDPICAVNANSANPHYAPSKGNSVPIVPGDFILIDLWCKKDLPQATYADISRVGVAASCAKEKEVQIFSVVKNARDKALELVEKKFSRKETLMGCEVDQAARDVIAKAGYGPYFIHRTGHNIDEKDHGDGAHIDNYETEDKRVLLAGTCFSIEPGIYLPNEFGVRLEYDVYIHHDGKVQVTGGIQDSIVCLV